jgi:hypothetical protein
MHVDKAHIQSLIDAKRNKISNLSSQIQEITRLREAEINELDSLDSSCLAGHDFSCRHTPNIIARQNFPPRGSTGRILGRGDGQNRRDSCGSAPSFTGLSALEANSACDAPVVGRRV